MAEPASAELTADTIEAKLHKFLQAKTKQTWERDADLFKLGVVSSLFAMELVVFVEGEFGIEVEGPDLVLDNFRTVGAMTGLVLRLRREVTDA